MNIKISGHHIEVTPAIRDYVTSKMERIARHFEQVMDITVIMSVDKLVQKVEANVHISGKDIFVQTEDADMYAAIDALADKLDRQVLKHKEKNHDTARHGSSIKHQTVEE